MQLLLSFLTKKKRLLINSVLLLVLFGLSFWLTSKYSQSYHFVDEDEHFVIGNYINQGYRIYTDLSANHQPLIYLYSALVQKVAHPQTLFSLFKSARMSVLMWSVIGAIWLVSQFGFIMLPFILFYEATKVFLFGNLFLSESFIIYPLVYIVAECFRLTFYNYQPKKWPVIIYGFANFLIIFNLLPLSPALFLLNLWYLSKIKHKRVFMLSLIIPTVLLFVFVQPLDYFRETIYYNWKYTIPFLSPAKTEYLRLLIFPFISFFVTKNSIINQWIILFSLVFISNVIILMLNKKFRLLLGLLIFYLLITLINNRNTVPGEMFYNGFHLLPWYAAFVIFNLLITKLVFLKKLKLKFISTAILLVGGIYLMLSPHMPYFEPVDPLKEHNTNFLPYYLIELGIKTVVKEGDRLMVLPDETLVYWNSGVKPATRQIIYHSWEYQVPLLRDDMNRVLTTNPPEFIYANFDRIANSDYRQIIDPILRTQYWQVNVNGVAQNLHIKRTKIKSISESEWQAWLKLSFDRINL
jgi:hypothetical protein